MKIVVCGEGSKRGSGKRIMVALLAKGVQERGYEGLVVDSDGSNFGPHRTTGFDRASVPLIGIEVEKRHLKQRMSQPEVLAQA